MRETLIEAWQLISLLTEKLVNFISQITNPLAHLVEKSVVWTVHNLILLVKLIINWF